MKRYLSHFSILYPTLFLKNHVVELDENGQLTAYYPFEKELPNVEFYSGLLLFIPDENQSDVSLIQRLWEERKLEELRELFDAKRTLQRQESFRIYHFE